MNSVVSVSLKVVGDISRDINRQLTSVRSAVGGLNSSISTSTAALTRNIRNSISTLNSSLASAFSNLSSRVRALGSQIRPVFTQMGNLLGNAIKAGIVTAIGAAVTVGMAAVNQIKGAMQSQEQQFSIANTIRNTQSISMAAALKQAKEVTSELAKMANALPGENPDYISAFTNNFGVLSGIQGLSGKQAKNAAVGLSAGDVLQRLATPGVSDTQILDLNTKFITQADNVSDLRATEAGLKSGAFLKELEALVTKSGKTLAALTATERVSLLAQAKQQFYASAEYIDTLSNSFGGQLQALKGSLFDATTGIFGFNRNVAASSGETTTVIDELAAAFKRITTALSAGSLGFDPLKPVIDSIRAAALYLQDTITQVVDIFKTKPPSQAFAKTLALFATQIAELFNAVDWSGYIATAGKVFGQVLIAAISEIVKAFVGSLDWGKVCSGLLMAGLAVVITGVVSGIAAAATTFVAGIAASFAGAVLAFNPVTLAAVGAAAAIVAIIVALKAVFDLAAIKAKELGDKVANTGGQVAAAVAGVEYVDESQISYSLSESEQQLIRARVGSANAATSTTGNFANGNDPFGVFAAITRERIRAPGTNPVIANDSEMILNPGQQRSLAQAAGNQVSISNQFNITSNSPMEVRREIELFFNQLTYKLNTQWLS